MHDFDTLFGIKVVFDRIDETTAAGPVAINTRMPPDAPGPSLEERRQLGEWPACGMPSMSPGAVGPRAVTHLGAAITTPAARTVAGPARARCRARP